MSFATALGFLVLSGFAASETKDEFSPAYAVLHLGGFFRFGGYYDREPVCGEIACEQAVTTPLRPGFTAGGGMFVAKDWGVDVGLQAAFITNAAFGGSAANRIRCNPGPFGVQRCLAPPIPNDYWTFAVPVSVRWLSRWTALELELRFFLGPAVALGVSTSDVYPIGGEAGLSLAVMFPIRRTSASAGVLVEGVASAARGRTVLVTPGVTLAPCIRATF